MVIACFAAGALCGVAQFLLVRKVLADSTKSARGALYIALLLILSLALLVVTFLISETALLAAAAGLVATLITMAVVNSLKR